MTESPLEVAKTLYMLTKDAKGCVTMTDINVGMYLYYGFSITKNQVNPFSEEPEAWPCGIVFPSVANKLDISKDEEIMNSKPKLNDMQKCVACCNYVINNYLRFDVSSIVNLMTEQGNNTPWLTSVRDGNALRNKVRGSVVMEWFRKNINK